MIDLDKLIRTWEHIQSRYKNFSPDMRELIAMTIAKLKELRDD